MKPSINKIKRHITEIEIETLRMQRQQQENNLKKPLKINTKQHKEQTTKEITNHTKQQKREINH